MTVCRCFLALILVSFAVTHHLAGAEAADEPAIHKMVKFARFKVNDKTTFGIVERDHVREISGSIFGDWKKTDKEHALSDVMLMVPTRPQHVFAMAGNYKSHLKGAEIRTALRGQIRELPVKEYVAAKRFLKSLVSSVELPSQTTQIAAK